MTQYSEPEKVTCRHGRIYWQRWAWADDATIETSQPDIGHNGCKKCQEEE